MSIGAGPPANPPMMSPDGQWVWDGQRWLPVAKEMEVSSKAIFPAWNAVAVERAETIAPVVRATPAQVAAPAPAPVIIAPISYSVEGTVPPWERRPNSSKSNYIYLGAALVVILIAISLLTNLGPITWPWSATASDSVPIPPSPTPPPLTSRSDFSVADRFANGWLAPAVAGLTRSMAAQRLPCNGTLSFSCQAALKATDKQVKYALAVIDRQAFPTCIATSVAKLKVDLVGMDTALQAALQSYTDNRRTELGQALGRFAGASQPLAADTRAVDAAPKAYCGTQVVGP